MKIFVFKGYYRDGRKVKGKVVALSLEEAKGILERKGIYPTKIKESRFAIEKFLPITDTDWAFIFSTYAKLLKAGISVSRATISILEEQFNPKIGLLLYEVLEYLSDGLPFSVALEKTGQVPKEVVEMIRIGEQSGKLTEVLLELRDFYRERAGIKSAVIEALSMPALLVLIIIGFVLKAPSILEKFELVYKKIPQAEFPAYSKVVIGTLNLLAKLLPLILLVLFLLVWQVKKLRERNGAFREKVDALILKLPVVGKIILLSHLYKAFLSLKILYSAGIPIHDAVKMIAEATGNEILKRGWLKVLEEINKGEAFHEALKSHSYIPSLIKSLIAFGIESGMLEEQLAEIVDYERTKFKSYLNFVKNTVGPFILVLLSVVVGMILVAMYLPLFSITDVMKKAFH